MSDTADPIAPETPADIAPADDLAAAIGSAFDQVEAAQGEGPQRDERGRFAAVERDGEVADEPETPVEEPADEEQAEAPEEARPEVPRPVTNSALDKIAEEYQPYYAAAGITAEQATRMLFEAHKGILRDPVAGIRALATQYGVDLAQFAPRQQPAQPAPASNEPQDSAVMQRLAAVESFLVTQQQQAQAREAQGVEQSISAFAADPKHPHFPAVRTMMGALMQAGTAKDMESAYEMACRAHPEVWAKVQAEEAAAKAKAEADRRAKAAAAARAKAPVVRTNVPAANGAAEAPRDWGSLVEAAWEGRLQ